MHDNVNVPISKRSLIPVRPFMVLALRHAERRLVEKQDENAPGPGRTIESWDDVSFYWLAFAAHRKLEDFLASSFDDPDRGPRDLVDALNFIGMSYDTFRQLREGE